MTQMPLFPELPEEQKSPLTRVVVYLPEGEVQEFLLEKAKILQDRNFRVLFGDWGEVRGYEPELTGEFTLSGRLVLH